MKEVLDMLFLIFSNTNILLVEKKLTWRSYIRVKALIIPKQIELINKIEFAKTTLEEEFKTFVVYVVIVKTPLVGIIIHLL